MSVDPSKEIAAYLSKHGLPSNLLENNAPVRYFRKRKNRKKFFLFLSDFSTNVLNKDLPLPSEDIQAWYDIEYKDLLCEHESLQKSIGRSVFGRFSEWNENLKPPYGIIAIIDAFPEISWDIWRFTRLRLGSRGRKNTDSHTIWGGYNLPHPEDPEITRDSRVLTVSGFEVCKSYMIELGRVVGAGELCDWERGWKGISWKKIGASDMPNSKKFEKQGCPDCPDRKIGDSLCMYDALSHYFRDLQFFPWLVMKNCPAGFMNKNPRAGESQNEANERARREIRWYVEWLVKEDFRINIYEEDRWEILYELDQNILNRYASICSSASGFVGSPKEMLKFAFTMFEWDDTRFGKPKKRQSLIYRLLKLILPDEVIVWEARSKLGKMKPKYEDQKRVHNIEEDILLEGMSVLVDVLGEMHFHGSDWWRGKLDRREKIETTQEHDVDRWKKRLAKGGCVITIGYEFDISKNKLEKLLEIPPVRNIEIRPDFQYIFRVGWPKDKHLIDKEPEGNPDGYVLSNILE